MAELELPAPIPLTTVSFRLDGPSIADGGRSKAVDIDVVGGADTAVGVGEVTPVAVIDGLEPGPGAKILVALLADPIPPPCRCRGL